MNVRLRLETRFGDDLPRPWMNRENNRFVDRVEGAQNAPESRHLVRVLAAVNGCQQISLLLQSKSLQDRRLVHIGALLRPIQNVQHDVPNQMDVLQDAFSSQVADSRVTRAKQQV